MTSLSVIVPAHNAAATLQRALSALEEQDLGEAYEVIVVDDGSTDGTTEIAARAKGVTLLRQGNLGAAAARNHGVAAARGELLAFTDADCFPDRRWLSAGSAAARRHDLIQGRVSPDPSARRGAFDRSLSVERPTSLYQTANLFVRREAFERVGGFERLTGSPGERPFGEDVLFGWRVRRSGGSAAFCPEAIVYHAVFLRRAIEFVLEHWRRRHFPAMAATIPELRRELFFARAFLDHGTAAFDTAITGALAAAALRSLVPLATSAPYLASLAQRALPHRWHAPRAAATYLAADAVGLVGLLYGSARAGALVI